MRAKPESMLDNDIVVKQFDGFCFNDLGQSEAVCRAEISRKIIHVDP